MGGQFPDQIRPNSPLASFVSLKSPFSIFNGTRNTQTMNNPITEKSQARPMNELDTLLGMLHAHDVLSVIFRPEECKNMIVKLGLTIPIEKDKRLLCSNDGKGSIYLFACIPDSNRNNGRMEITGYRFDIEQYQHRPVKGIPDAWTAFRYCSMAVAQIEGLDAANCRLETPHPIQN
jgi:hypothetical protein